MDYQQTKNLKQGKAGLRKERVFWLRIAVAAALTLTGFLLPDSLAWLTITLHAFAFASLALDMLLRSVSHWQKGRFAADPMLIFLAGLILFFIGGSLWAAVIIIQYRALEILRLGLVKRLREHNGGADDFLPENTMVLRNGEELEVPTKRVLIGDTILVQPGEPIPLDGVVLEGESDVSAARITGEMKGSPVSQGDRVFAGFINGISVLMIRVTAAEEDSALHQARRVAKKSRELRGETERVLDRLSMFFTCGIIAAAVLIVVLPLLLLQDADPKEWIGRGVCLLAAGGTASFLFTISFSYSRCAAHLLDAGCAINSHRSVELLGKLSLVVLDKTQLSDTDCTVVSAVTMSGVDASTLNRCASIVYYHHNDRISHSLRRFCGDVGYPPDRYREIPGYGVSASFSGQMMHAGSSAYLERMGIQTVRTGTNTLHIALDNAALGYYILSESLKGEAETLFGSLRAMGYKTALFSPDPKDRTQADADAVGADIARGEVLSRDKGGEIQKLRENHPGIIAYVGGAGDTGALHSADIGILCDGLRNPAGPEHRGAILLASTPESLPGVLRKARRGYRDIKLFVRIGGAVKLAFPLLCAFGFLPIALVVLLDGLLAITLTAVAGRPMQEQSHYREQDEPA